MTRFDRPLTERLRQHAREKPGAAAYIWNDVAITWSELDRASDAFAAQLQALGVKKGDPVAMFLGNCPQYVMAHFGIQKAGAIVCPCGPLFKEHELHYQLDDLKTRVLVADEALLPVVEQVRSRTALEHVFTVWPAKLTPAEPPAGCLDFLTAIRAGGVPAPVPLVDERRRPDDVHLGHHRSPQGGHAHPRQRALQDGGVCRVQRRPRRTT